MRSKMYAGALGCRSIAFIATAWFWAAPAIARENPCTTSGHYIVVVTSAHQLFLCEQSTIVESFPVSLGKAGVGNHANGANRTPLGAFKFSPPRPSKRFGIFIAFIEDWGIHGPARAFRWAGKLNTSVDWTLGCIATGSDPEIQQIADWIRQNRVRRIFILENEAPLPPAS